MRNSFLFGPPLITGNRRSRLRRFVANRLAVREYSKTNLMPPNPKLAVLLPTYKCNLRCHMCPQWGKNGTTPSLPKEELKQELPLAAIKPFIDKIAPGQPTIHISGGEALMHHGIIEIIDYLKSRNLRVVLSTNGVFLADVAEPLVSLGIDFIAVSIDGPEEVHDRIRGVKGAFTKAAAGIQAVAAAKSRAKQATPRLMTQTTISATNMNRLIELMQVLSELPIDLCTIHHLEYTDAHVVQAQMKVFKEAFAIENDRSWAGLVQEPGIDPSEIVSNLKRAITVRDKPAVKLVPDLLEKEIEQYYSDVCFTPVSFPKLCLFPWRGTMLQPNGDIVGCPNYKAGNIHESTFGDIWHGPAYQSLRSELRRRAVFPICSKCCWYYFNSY